MAVDRKTESAAGNDGMDPVADLLGGGRTVAYKTALAHACGGATVGLLLSQFWYWTNSTAVRERGGWFWKTMEEITDETGLTRSEQESARKKLKQLGVLVEEFRDLPRKLYFRIDKRRLYQVLQAHVDGGEGKQEGSSGASSDQREPTINNAGFPHYGSGKTRIIDCGKSAVRIAENLHALSEQETTAKITAKNTTTEPAQLNSGSSPGGGSASSAVAVVAANAGREGEKLVQKLTEAGVGRTVALRLAEELPEECMRQLQFLPFATGIKNGTGAYLRTAIEQGYGPPPGWENAQRAKTTRVVTATRCSQNSAATAAESARRAKCQEIRAALRQSDPEAWSQIVSQAEQRLAPPVRNRPDSAAYRASMERHIDDILISRPLQQ